MAIFVTVVQILPLPLLRSSVFKYKYFRRDPEIRDPRAHFATTTAAQLKNNAAMRAENKNRATTAQLPHVITARRPESINRIFENFFFGEF